MNLMLNDVRCSFLVLGEPEYFSGEKSKPDDKRRWSATALIPKSNKALIEKIDDMLRSVAREQWPQKWEMMLANILPDPKGCCWVDGKRKEYEGYADSWALTAHRTEDKGRPLVYDSDKTHVYMGAAADASKGQSPNDLISSKAGRMFSGLYVDMHVELWAQDNKAGKGLRATLLGIQRRRIGEAFGGGSPPNPDAFGEIAEEKATEEERLD